MLQVLVPLGFSYVLALHLQEILISMECLFFFFFWGFLYIFFGFGELWLALGFSFHFVSFLGWWVERCGKICFMILIRNLWFCRLYCSIFKTLLSFRYRLNYIFFANSVFHVSGVNGCGLEINFFVLFFLMLLLLSFVWVNKKTIKTKNSDFDLGAKNFTKYVKDDEI